MRCRVAVALVVAAGLTGCQNRSYVGEEGLFAFALTEDTAPSFQGGDGAALFLVEERVELPIKAPSEARLAELQAEAEGQDFVPRMPWVERGDYEIEVDWMLSNLDDEPSRITLVLNGFSEFHEYEPGFLVDDDEVIPDFAQWERTFILEPEQRRAGTIREEHIDEATVDLATVANGAPNGNQIVHPDSQHEHDPRAKPFIPEVIPALTGIRLGLRAQAAANVLVEATVRVRDESGRIVGRDAAWELPQPEIITPRMAGID